MKSLSLLAYYSSFSLVFKQLLAKTLIGMVLLIQEFRPDGSFGNYRSLSSILALNPVTSSSVNNNGLIASSQRLLGKVNLSYVTTINYLLKS
jgi:hypothetical protein